MYVYNSMKRKRNIHESLQINEIPVPSKFKHPPPPNEVLPKHEFTMGIIAPKGSGKTTLICNLLKFYKGYFHTIIIFSPTVASDEKWDYIKSLPLLAENTALRQFLANEEKKIYRQTIVESPPDPVPQVERQIFDPKIPEDCFKSEYESDDLAQLMRDQMKMVRYLKKKGQSKHLANRCLIIFDDLVGSQLFSASRDNPFKMFNTNHRHYSFSAIMVSQAYKEIPKTVRTQFSCGILFEIPNDKEIEVIYEETPLGYKRDAWQKIYEHCVEDEYSFFYFNYQKPKKLRIMKKFDSYVLGQ